jgi:hypothetical protein
MRRGREMYFTCVRCYADSACMCMLCCHLWFFCLLGTCRGYVNDCNFARRNQLVTVITRESFIYLHYLALGEQTMTIVICVFVLLCCMMLQSISVIFVNHSIYFANYFILTNIGCSLMLAASVAC